MTRLGYLFRVGHLPQQDDLERVNCPKAGDLGHWYCGWCPTHHKPYFICGCRNHTPRGGTK